MARSKEKMNQWKLSLKQTYFLIVLKMLTELKEDMEKVNKVIYEQKGNINKKIQKPKKNFFRSCYV